MYDITCIEPVHDQSEPPEPHECEPEMPPFDESLIVPGFYIGHVRVSWDDSLWNRKPQEPA